jgi:hypothetical protein
MPKPSERISEIENQDNNTNRTDAIIQYLDEQHEQNKPCEHESCQFINREVGATQSSYGLIPGTYYSHYCNDCKEYLLWPFGSGVESK